MAAPDKNNGIAAAGGRQSNIKWRGRLRNF